MRGDQLARERDIFRAIEARLKALTVTEIAQREETGIRTIYRDLEALQAAGFHLYTEKVERATGGLLSTPSNLKSLPLFELTSLHFYQCKFSALTRNQRYLLISKALAKDTFHMADTLYC